MGLRHEFDAQDVEALLVRCHRRCCVCHRYCGVKIEIDHIDPATEEDSGDISNAIPLCFECHAEVHHYNPSHPKGRRFRPSELRAHCKQWLQLCSEHPEIFVHAQPPPEAGSIERLLNELEFNQELAKTPPVCGLFEMAQFRRAIADGTFTWLPDDLKSAIQKAYAAIKNANRAIERMGYADHPAYAVNAAREAIKQTLPVMDAAVTRLRNAL